jgi:tetratricopeptide (TPR) repeat protein/CHAT domain-containing protein
VSEESVKLWNVVELLTNRARYREAIPVAERLLVVTERDCGQKSPEAARVVGRVGLLYSYLGVYDLAERHYKQALAILYRLRPLRPERGGNDFRSILHNFGALYRKMSRFEEAESILKQVLEMRVLEISQETPEDSAFTYNELGLVYLGLKRYNEAERFLITALSIRESSAESDKALIAISLDNLGQVYLRMNRFTEAQDCFTRGLRLFVEALGETHIDTLWCLRNLATVYERSGQGTKALDLLSAALDSIKAARGEDNTETEALLRDRGRLHRTQRHLALAAADLHRALSISASRGNDGAARTEDILLELSELYEEARDHSQSDAMLERAQEIREQRLGPEHASLAFLYARRGGMQLLLQEPSSAKGLFQQALEIDIKAHGANDLLVARDFSNLASAHMYLGELPEAQSCLERAISIKEMLQTTGDDTETAANKNKLGCVLERLGRLEEAERAYRSSLAIYDRLLGSDHRKAVHVKQNLGLVLLSQGKSEEAKQAARAHDKEFEDTLFDLLASGTEQQRDSFVNAFNPWIFWGTMGEAEPLAASLFKYKGLITDSLLADRAAARRSALVEDREGLMRWQNARRNLTQCNLKVEARSRNLDPVAFYNWRQERDRLVAELAEAETTFARHGAGPALARFAFNLKVDDMQARIPCDTALLEFIRYTHYLGKAKTEARYGVVIARSQGTPQWVSLGSARDIEQEIELYTNIIRRQPLLFPPNWAINLGFIDLHTVAAKLYDRLIAPVLCQMQEEPRRLLISPDSELNFISFGTLVTPDDRFLAEKYCITYLACGRHVMREASEPASKTVLIFDSPTFRLRTIPPTESKGPVGPLGLGASFPVLESLSFSAAECDWLTQIAEQNGWKVTRHQKEEATEEELRSAASPAILHLATHGFYLREFGVGLVEKYPAENRSHDFSDSYYLGPECVELKDPMCRSGLALAGAQDTLEDWRNSKVPKMETDGILNGEEAGMLDLQGTWIVTLSSCDSGRGEFKPGEGVFGLRRGFLAAGAQNLLTTLWPIDDEATAALIAAFYRKALRIGNAPDALATVQRDFLRNLRTEYGFDEAVSMAGAFVMISRGVPSAKTLAELSVRDVRTTKGLDISNAIHGRG